MPVVTDQNLLHHIVSNLLSNAVRYSPAGTTITVRVTGDAWQIHLAVEDQGIGIPPADRDRIFDPFERGSNVGQIKGNGLGLNIVKRLTDLLGGSITLRPLPGGGTCFTLVLPHSAPGPAPSPLS
jgi:signal transduction histidine kinase